MVQVQDAHLLQEDQLASYRRAGWLVVPDVLARSELETVRKCCLAAELPDCPAAAGRDASYSYLQHENYRRMFTNHNNVRLAFPELRPVVATLGALARQLLRTSDIRVILDRTFNKPPVTQGTRETVWHQDQPYAPVDRRGMMTIWVPLEDVTIESGALRFLPGSHRLGSIGRVDLVGETPSLGELLAPEDYELIGDPVAVPVKAGGVTIHDGMMLHGAGPNLTSRARRAWSCTFIPGTSLWTGASYPHADFAAYGMKPFQTFDHPDLRVD